MDHSQFLQILATCTAFTEQKRQEIAEATKGLEPAQLLEFSTQLLGLHAKLGAVSKQESALVMELEKVVKNGGRTLARADRTQKEHASTSEEGKVLGSLLDQ